MKIEQFKAVIDKMTEANKISISKFGEFNPADWLSELGAWLHEEATITEKEEIELVMPDMA